MTTSIPEQGQLVDVRRRQWVVADINRSLLPPDPLRPNDPVAQHLITLNSVEDDSLGEEMQVIWEIEPGARILEKAGLPTPKGFDPPERLDAFLDAVRWGAATNADVQMIQSPFRSGIAIEDYQLDPVVRAIDMPRANLLIADDVGLGKTIEAGLVIQELILRHRARTALVVCPASLQVKWRDEMAEKFGLEFRIVDTTLLKELRRTRGIHTNPWTHFPRLIVSIDWLKRDLPMRFFRDVLPLQATYPRKFDILVVDEAHNVAPARSENYSVDTQRTLAIRTLTPHFEHRLFLTATPHNGYQESFTSLLELLDAQRFARGVQPDEAKLHHVMVRRLKDDILDWKGDPLFPKRRIIPLVVDYNEEERAVHAALAEYARLRHEAAKESGSGFATDFVLRLLKKRLFSSPMAFALTLEKHRATMTGAKQKETEKATRGILRRAIAEVEEDYAEDDEYEEALGEAVLTAGGSIEPLSGGELKLLNKMLQWAEQAKHRKDSKAAALLRWLEQHIRPNGKWSDNRVLIFTEYRATQNWLLELLAAEGYTEGDRTTSLYGGMDPELRESVKNAFQASPGESAVRILVATDAASEGIDLQNHCHMMVHLEIPWNPNRLEQRNGRIDRHGQRAKEVLIHHFVGAGYRDRSFDAAAPVGTIEGDLEFLMIAVRKTEQIRQDLGKVGPVIATQVEDAMLGRRKSLNTTEAERQAEPSRKLLKIERDIKARVERLHDALVQSRKAQRLSPEHIERVVQVGLDIAKQPPLEPTTLQDVWPDPSGKRDRCPVYLMPPFGGTWARCTQGLQHPYTGKRRPITFDHSVAANRDDVVLVHLNHRLVQMCLRLLRAEVWAPDVQRRLERVTARVVDGAELEAPAVIVHGRLVVIGRSRHRLHEEVISAGGTIRAGRFRRFERVSDVDRLLRTSEPVMPPTSLLEDLKRIWGAIETSAQAALESRKDDRVSGVLGLLERRRDKEIADIRHILDDLYHTIKAQLDEPEGEQFALWTTEEQDQLRRNLGGLRARLHALPAEMEAECEVIRARYASPDARLFPVAVTFLVPGSMAGGSR